MSRMIHNAEIILVAFGLALVQQLLSSRATGSTSGAVSAEDASGLTESRARRCLFAPPPDERRVELRCGRHGGRGNLVSVRVGVEDHNQFYYTPQPASPRTEVSRTALTTHAWAMRAGVQGMPGSQAMDTSAPNQALEILEGGTRNQVSGNGPGVCVPKRSLEGVGNGEGDGILLPSPMAHQQLRLRYEGGKL